MGIWTYLWSSSTQETTQSKDGDLNSDTVVSTVSKEVIESHEARAVIIEEVKESTTTVVDAVVESPARKRRISFRQAFSRSTTSLVQPKAIPAVSHTSPTIQEFQEAPSEPAAKETPSKPRKERISKADRRAKKSAERLKVLITGDATTVPAQVSPVMAKARLDKIKSQLSDPKTGNKVIAELRKLPVGGKDIAQCEAPIHAVCLEHTEAEEDALYFSKLNSTSAVKVESLTMAPADKVAEVLKGMNVIDLVTAPNLGLGQPGDGKGLLAGALPTPETVLNGAKQITPQLMALGYATGRMVTPDHTNIYPPTDRISVLTYWWGMELLLPPPTLKYLETVQSITSSVVNFLSGMALVNNGIREILPLIRYIAQFIDLEYKTIKAQDKGKGVVCAATWLMPAALVPRPWDFPDPPAQEEDPSPAELAASGSNSTEKPPLKSPRPISSVVDIVAPAPLGAPVSVQA